MSSAAAAASDHPPAAAVLPPQQHQGGPQDTTRRRGRLALLWLFFALGVVGTVLLVLLGGGGPGEGGQQQQEAGGPVPLARVTLGPRAKKAAASQQQEQAAAASPPRCCTTEYGAEDDPVVAVEAAVLGVGTPNHWGGVELGRPTDGKVEEAQLLRAAADDAAAAAANVDSSSGNGGGNGGPRGLDGVAYLVVTSARDEVGYVAGLLGRLDDHWARLHRAYPLVVFLAGAGMASDEDEARLHAAAPHTRLDVRRVPHLQQLAAAAAEMAAASKGNNASAAAAAADAAAAGAGDAAAWAYARALWEFRVSAPRMLVEEHEWVLHLSEETLLDEDVLLDPFLALQASNRKLGYMTAHRAVHEEGLWAFGRAFAQQHQTAPEAAFHLTKDVPKALDGRWIAFHRSVVAADNYQALIVGLASSNLTQPQALHAPPPPPAESPAKDALLRRRFGGSPSRRGDWRRVQAQGEEATGGGGGDTAVSAAVEALPQEAAVLTVGALLGLRPADFLQFQGVTLQRPPPGRGGPTSVEGAPAPGPGGAGAETVSQWRDVKITGRAAEDLQPLFDVRREGWLGADVATSFRLPPQRPEGSDGQGPEEGEEEDGRYLWLFGDTLLGRSSADKRRRGAYFIHNSVAFLPAYNSTGPRPKPEDVVFAWNASRGGCPVSIFVRQQQDDECLHQQDYLWPISGIGVSYGGTAKAVVLAVRWTYTTAPGAGVDLFTDDAFNFKILGTTVLVVDNPHDDPQRWRYRQKDIPGTDENLNWYSAVLHERKGAELATDPDDRIYLFGVNTTVAPGTPPQQWQYETLARVPVSSLVDLTFEGMEVWAHRRGRRGATPPSPMPPSANGSDPAAPAPHWVPYRGFLRRRMDAAPLIFPVFSETSVHYSEGLGAYYGVVVDWLATTVVLYIAEELTGPWEAVPCYKIPPPFDSPSLYMTYAGKAHPELALAGDDEIILTYMTNSPGDLEPLFEAGALDVYVPRFVRLHLERAAPMAVPAKRRVV